MTRYQITAPQERIDAVGRVQATIEELVKMGFTEMEARRLVVYLMAHTVARPKR